MLLSGRLTAYKMLLSGRLTAYDMLLSGKAAYARHRTFSSKRGAASVHAVQKVERAAAREPKANLRPHCSTSMFSGLTGRLKSYFGGPDRPIKEFRASRC